MGKSSKFRWGVTTVLGLCWFIFNAPSFAAPVTVAGTTVDVFLSGRAGSRTVVYVPGCNGKDAIGRLYQTAHLDKLKSLFDDDVNVLMVQVFDDVTKGAKDGVCYLDAIKQNELGTNSLVLARKVGDILPWVKSQPWFTGTAHFSVSAKVVVLVFLQIRPIKPEGFSKPTT